MTAAVETTDREQLQRLAEEGRRAAEQLNAADQASRERRTAELAAEQGAYDRDLCTRAPVEDAGLARQRTEAQADLDAAAYAADMDRAMRAWTRGRTARLAQRRLRSAWAQARARCGGVGTAPPEPSLRQAEDDELHAFTRELDRALEKAARVDAEVAVADLVGDRPTALPAELLPGPEELLEHAAGCPDPSRTERATAPAGSRSTGVVLRCMSCSASRVLFAPPPEPEEIEAAQRGKAMPDMRQPAPGDRPGSGT